MPDDDRSHFIIPQQDAMKVAYEKSGGGKTYQRGDLRSHGQTLLQNFSAIDQAINATKDSSLVGSVTVSVKTPPEWAVRNEKMHLEELGFRLLEYSKADSSIATLNIPKQRWVEVGRRIGKYAEPGSSGKTYFQGIDGFIARPASDTIQITIPLPEVKKIPVSISFFSVFAPNELAAVSAAILSDLQGKGEVARLVKFSDEDVQIVCTASVASLAAVAKDYLTVRAIVDDAEVNIEEASLKSTGFSPSIVATPSTSQTVAVVDDGIFPRADLSGLVSIRVAPQVPNAVSVPATHGTFVASRCAFGDIDMSMVGSVLTPSCFLADIPVFGLDPTGAKISPRESDLTSALDAFVSANFRKVRVYNLSLGFGSPTTMNRISEAAKRLDFLSRKYDVLFVVSAGNIAKQLGRYPEEHFSSTFAKIMSPAESLLCLAVGSIAKRAKATSMSQNDEVSAFSRIGPGLFGSIKPELVAHGGNIDANYAPDPDVATYGFSTTPGILESEVGTSFSAPLISHYAAQLFDFYPMFGTNMVRALLIHNSFERNFPANTNLPSHFGSGYGEPSLSACLGAGVNNCTYLYEGELNTTEYDYVSFFVPKSLTDARQNFRIRVTIVMNPEVNRNNDLEYSCARISSSIMRLKNGILEKKSPTDANVSEPYNSVVHFENVFRRGVESGNWAIRLRLFARNVDKNTYLQKYALVVELIDQKNGRDLRNEVLEATGGKYLKPARTRQSA